MDPILYEVEFILDSKNRIKSGLPAEFQNIILVTDNKYSWKSRLLLLLADKLVSLGTSLKRNVQYNIVEHQI